MKARIQLDIHEILMPWQYVTRISILHEVNALDIIALEEYVLLL